MSLVRNPFPQAFPSGEGGSRVSHKRETDEGLPRRVGETVFTPSVTS